MDKEEDFLFKLQSEHTRQHAFQSLIIENQERLYWHLRRLLIRHEDAEDALQDTFIRAYKYIDGFKGECKLSTWLYTIATRQALKLLQRKRLFLFSDAQMNAHLEQQMQHELIPDADQMEKALQCALIKLPQKQRLVFNLRHFDDLSYEEIHIVTGMTISTAKTNYHYAFQKVKAHIINNDMF
jgi:RNA polymerase sigma-70 factor (ECF subfamily)